MNNERQTFAEYIAERSGVSVEEHLRRKKRDAETRKQIEVEEGLDEEDEQEEEDKMNEAEQTYAIKIQARITEMKSSKITEHNAVPFALEYGRVLHYVQSAATQRKLDIRYGKAVKFIQAQVSLAKAFSDQRKMERFHEMQKRGEA
jgi:hypothetical protein